MVSRAEVKIDVILHSTEDIDKIFESFLDNFNLEELSEIAKEENKWEFLISLQPLRLEGGTGSPLNAIAIF